MSPSDAAWRLLKNYKSQDFIFNPDYGASGYYKPDSKEHFVNLAQLRALDEQGAIERITSTGTHEAIHAAQDSELQHLRGEDGRGHFSAHEVGAHSAQNPYEMQDWRNWQMSEHGAMNPDNFETLDSGEKRRKVTNPNTISDVTPREKIYGTYEDDDEFEDYAFGDHDFALMSNKELNQWASALRAAELKDEPDFKTSDEMKNDPYYRFLLGSRGSSPYIRGSIEDELERRVRQVDEDGGYHQRKFKPDFQDKLASEPMDIAMQLLKEVGRAESSPTLMGNPKATAYISQNKDPANLPCSVCDGKILQQPCRKCGRPASLGADVLTGEPMDLAMRLLKINDPHEDDYVIEEDLYGDSNQALDNRHIYELMGRIRDDGETHNYIRSTMNRGEKGADTRKRKEMLNQNRLAELEQKNQERFRRGDTYPIYRSEPMDIAMQLLKESYQSRLPGPPSRPYIPPSHRRRTFLTPDIPGYHRRGGLPARLHVEGDRFSLLDYDDNVLSQLERDVNDLGSKSIEGHYGHTPELNRRRGHYQDLLEAALRHGYTVMSDMRNDSSNPFHKKFLTNLPPDIEAQGEIGIETEHGFDYGIDRDSDYISDLHGDARIEYSGKYSPGNAIGWGDLQTESRSKVPMTYETDYQRYQDRLNRGINANTDIRARGPDGVKNYVQSRLDLSMEKPVPRWVGMTATNRSGGEAWHGDGRVPMLPTNQGIGVPTGMSYDPVFHQKDRPFHDINFAPSLQAGAVGIDPRRLTRREHIDSPNSYTSRREYLHNKLMNGGTLTTQEIEEYAGES